MQAFPHSLRLNTSPGRLTEIWRDSAKGNNLSITWMNRSVNKLEVVPRLLSVQAISRTNRHPSEDHDVLRQCARFQNMTD
jgi:hypothetical protein